MLWSPQLSHIGIACSWWNNNGSIWLIAMGFGKHCRYIYCANSAAAMPDARCGVTNGRQTHRFGNRNLAGVAKVIQVPHCWGTRCHCRDPTRTVPMHPGKSWNLIVVQINQHAQDRVWATLNWTCSWAAIILWNNYVIFSSKFLHAEIKLFQADVDEGWNNFEIILFNM